MEPTLAPRPVMDIRPQHLTPQPLPPASFAAVSAAPTPNPAPVTAPAPGPALPELPEDHHEVQPTPTEFPAKLPKTKRPVVAIAAALIISVGLIGLTIFTYLNNQDQPAATPTTERTESVTADDVEAVTEDADAALEGLDDAADFNDTELSDDTLGL